MKKKLQKRINSLLLFALAVLFAACGGVGSSDDKPKDLPFIGEPDVEFRQDESGATVADTIYYTIPKFSFINQDSAEVSYRDYEGKIFVADFFFTRCPSICPMLSAQMLRLQQELKKAGLDKEVMLLSHSVDPLNDTPEVLKAYGDNLGADYSNWNFVTGSPEDIYYQAETGYMLLAFPSEEAEGGIFHTDKIALIDEGMHIRGYYDGTSSTEVDKLFEDLKMLIKQKNRVRE